MGGWKQIFVPAKPGLQISLLDFGGVGPTLLLCNANGFHGLCYYEMAKHLLDHFHCYAVDLRGTGDSCIEVSADAVSEALNNRSNMVEEWTRPSNSLPTIEGYAEDILAISNHMSWKELYLFGHSSGGCAVLAAIPKLPKIVRAAFIYEPVTIEPTKLREVGVIAPASEALARRALKRRHRFKSKEAAFQTYSLRGLKSFNKDMLWAYVDHGFRPAADGDGVELKCSRECEASIFALVERMSAEHFQALADITCPVTVGAGLGEFGGSEMAGRSEIVARQLKVGRFIRLQSSHFAPFERPQYFAERLVDALLLSRHSKL